jgi:ribosome-associated toxin RatA of RatAB toxin-antitoxin module
MENSGIFERMKRQWNILITGTWPNHPLVINFKITNTLLTSMYTYSICTNTTRKILNHFI